MASCVLFRAPETAVVVMGCIFICDIFGCKNKQIRRLSPIGSLLLKVACREGEIELDHCVLETIGYILINICH